MPLWINHDLARVVDVLRQPVPPLLELIDQPIITNQDGERGAQAIFVSQKGGGLTGKAINDVVKRLAAAADLQPYLTDGRGRPADVSAHTLRHSVAWRMLRDEDGYTMYDVRNRLRHSTLLTTERNYDHFDVI